MNKVLMIARVFPPFRSVGHSIRVVKFVRYLPAMGWLPSVLTIDDRREYEIDRKQGSETLLAEIPPEVPIYRTSAGEPSREYLEKERAFGQRNWLTRMLVKVFGGARRWAFRNLLPPDYLLVWLPFALRRGRQIVRRAPIDVIFATCPPHSATLIGACLKVVTRKPLILDFRDDWIDTPTYHTKPALTRVIERSMESLAIKTADKVILVTEWSRQAFLERYPGQPNGKFVLIPNGCDLADIAVLKAVVPAPNTSRFTILHAGSLNDGKGGNWTRTPTTLFQAVRGIVQEHPDLAGQLALAFTGVLPDGVRQVAVEMGLSGVVQELGFLQRADLVSRMQAADMLVAINYEGYATLIPGKIYEYWAVGGPPILLLTCPGAAANLVEQHNLGLTADPSDVAGIQEAILTVYRRSKSPAPMRIDTAGIAPYDRQALTRQLADILSTLR
jgi:glycosyltransferase involved in cell wall biosynthesis